MYILEYWVSDQEHDWLENIAVANTLEVLKNCQGLKEKTKEFEDDSKIWKSRIGEWKDSGYGQMARVTLNYEDRELDRGVFVIRPIDYVEGIPVRSSNIEIESSRTRLVCNHNWKMDWDGYEICTLCGKIQKDEGTEIK